MRGKRSKQYRKLMSQYQMTFGFREPYQCLVDAQIVRDSCQFKMELTPALERTVHGKVKPMITQCEIRKLYEQKNDPKAAEAIEVAKTFERRRCGHHPDEYPEPLSTEECLESVVDPKGTGSNKHRYVVASQDYEVRRMLRSVRGTPLIYIKRSVMILEPMADESAQVRAREERAKFRAEIKKPGGKRKRDDDDDEGDDKDRGSDSEAEDEQRKLQQLKKKEDKKKKYTKGAKGPNPLAVKKSKKAEKKKDPAAQNKKPQKPAGDDADGDKAEAKDGSDAAPAAEGSGDAPAKRKRRRKNKSAAAKGDEANASTDGPAEAHAEAEADAE